MKLFVTATFVPPPGVEGVSVDAESLRKEIDSQQLGATLREFLTPAPVGELLEMGASVVIVVSRNEIKMSAEIERVQ